MLIPLLYWILMILSLIGSGYLGFRSTAEDRWVGGWAFVAWILFLLIGLKLFAGVLHG
jgi:hypothetical protein